MERIRSDCLIIGGGIAGLAIAKSLVKRYKNIFLIEKNKSLGQEVSSRNSEVIHAGIYYKKNSLKSNLCIEGKKLLYEYLEERKIQHIRCGKFIISTSDEETIKLENIFENANSCGVHDLKFDNSIKDSYPFIYSKESLFSPSTGIFPTGPPHPDGPGCTKPPEPPPCRAGRRNGPAAHPAPRLWALDRPW